MKITSTLLLLALALPARAADPAPTVTAPLPPSEPPAPTAPPASPDPAAAPAEEVDCTAFEIDKTQRTKEERKHLQEICAKAPRKTPPPAPKPTPGAAEG